MKLTKLAASSIRGLPRGYPAWDIGERGMAILGPNGVGKSSIVDAVEVCLGRSCSVFPADRAGVNWERGGPHVGGGAPDVRIHVKHAGADYVIPLNAQAETPEDVVRWVELATNSTFLLRRHQMLRFILCEPRARYEQLGEFLNLDDYLAIEQRLLSRADGLQIQQAEVRRQIVDLEQNLRNAAQLQPFDLVTEATLLVGLQARLAATAGLPQCPDAAAVPPTVDELRNAQRASATSARLGTLAGLRAECQRLTVPASLTPLLEVLQAAVVELEHEAAAERELELIDLLIAGKKIISDGERNECPLCESGIDREAVLRRLGSRVEAGRKLIDARKRVDERVTIVLRPARALQQAWSDFSRRWPEVTGYPIPAVYGEVGDDLAELVDTLEKARLNAAALQTMSRRLAQTPASYAPLLDRVQELMQAEDDGGRRATIEAALDVATAIVERLPRLNDAREKDTRLNAARQTLERLHSHAVEARKTAVQGILDGVSKTANDMYGELHPDETVGASRLPVREAVSQSVNLVARFNNMEESPLLHYSESHLDTLGLCYFLAVRKHEAIKSPDFKLVVLDDVLHSVDADHRARIVSLLRREFVDHQLIITTHDEAFFNSLNQSFPGGIKMHKIVGWNLVDGPYLAKGFSSDMERVLEPEVAKTVDTQDLAATCGRVFERLLKELVQELEVPVVPKFYREYSIGDLWPPLLGALKKQHGFAEAYPKLAEDLDADKWIRNKCGAHASEMASPPTPAEVRRLAGLIGDLFRATHCESCRSCVSKSETDDWRCGCGESGFRRKKPSTAA